MPVIFAGEPGRVSMMVDPGVPAAFRLISLTPDINFQNHRSIVTRLSIHQQGNYQFLHTLGNSIYIYRFGDRIGSITIEGVSFGSCNGAVQQHGIEAMLAYYSANRLAARDQEVEVIIGRTPIRGFLVGMDADLRDPLTQMTFFSQQLVVLPDDDLVDPGTDGDGDDGEGEGDDD